MDINAVDWYSAAVIQGTCRDWPLSKQVVRCASRTQPRALTLLELLVGLGIIALLLAILLPVLAGARKSATDTVDLTNLRSTHQQLFEWGAAHSDYFLNAGPPAPDRDFSIEYGSCLYVGSYLAQGTRWPLVLAAWTGEGSPTWHSSHAPEPPPHDLSCRIQNVRYVVASAYYYTHAALVAPEAFNPDLWSDCSPEDPTRYYRFVRWSETAYPAEKGLLYDTAALAQDDGAPVAPVLFVDGGVSIMDFATSVNQMVNECPFAPVRRTAFGILGRDFAR